MTTLDNFVIALDAKTGKIVWKKQLYPADLGRAMTLAPLVLKECDCRRVGRRIWHTRRGDGAERQYR